MAQYGTEIHSRIAIAPSISSWSEAIRGDGDGALRAGYLVSGTET